MSGIMRVCAPTIDPFDCKWEQRTFAVTRTITERSDGLVTEDSQRMDGLAAEFIYEAPGANHLEVGNHPEVLASITDVFNRGDNLGIPRRLL